MIFHLAIPAKDLEESAMFYEHIGAKIGRVYETHIVMDFYGHQVVLHHSDQIDEEAQMYPRHFGIIFQKKVGLELLYTDFENEAFMWQKLFVRGLGNPHEHWSFFIKDPSNNLVEFKWYKYPENLF